MSKRTIVDAKVIDTEKRRFPSKHYVYKISVTWSEGSTLIVYRRYSKFFDLQVHLLELFPEEGGTKDPTKRMIPFLPGKKIFGRSHVREVAMKRLNPIDEYCRNLVRLPPKVSECDTVLQFFNVWPEDNDPLTEEEQYKKKKAKEQTGEVITDPILLEQYTAIADYKKQQKTEVNLKEGGLVEVVEKNENGWWFVRVDYEQGWVPASYLEKADGGEEPEGKRAKPGQEEPHITVNSYTAENDDEITFDQGVVVEVIQKNLDGWWLVRYQGREGWAPSAYLTKMKIVPEQTGGTAVQIVGSALEAIQSVEKEQRNEQMEENKKSPASNQVNKEKETGKKKLAPGKPLTVSTSRADSSAVAASLAAAAAMAKPTPRRNSIKSSRRPKTNGKAGALTKITENEKTKQNEDSPQYFVAIAVYENQHPSEVSFSAGAKAEVTQQDSNGWWFVHIGDNEGWAPSTYFELAGSPPIQPKSTNTEEQMKRKVKAKAPAPPKQAPKAKKKKKMTEYMTIAAFQSQAEDGISFGGGQVVEVEDKAPSGWWYVRIGGDEGWAPSSYIESREVEVEEEVNEPPVKPSKAKMVRTNDSHSSSPVTQALLSVGKSTDDLDLGKDGSRLASAVTTRAQRTQTTFSKSKSEAQLPASSTRRTTSAASIAPSQPENPLAAALAARAAKIAEQADSGSEVPLSGDTTSRTPLRQSHTKESTSLAAVLPASAYHSKKEDSQSGEKTSSPSAARKRAVPKPKMDKPAAKTSNEEQTEEKRRPAPKPRRATEVNSLAAAVAMKKKLETETQPKVKTDIPKATKPSSRIPRKMTAVSRPGEDEGGDAQVNVLAAAMETRRKKMESESQSPHNAMTKEAKVSSPQLRRTPVKKADTTNGSPVVVTIASFESDDGEFKFKSGETVDVLEKHENGWWFVKVGSSEGWAPSTFLEEKKQAVSPPLKKSPPARPSYSPASSRKPVQVTQNGPDSQPATAKRPKPPAVKKGEDTNNQKEMYSTVADFTAADQDGISFGVGETAEVIERDENGWWFIKIGAKEGWAPSTYLTKEGPSKKPKPRPPRPPVTVKEYRTVAAYSDDGLSFREGELVEVLEKADSGWWYVRIDSKEGWAPSTYIEKV